MALSKVARSLLGADFFNSKRLCLNVMPVCTENLNPHGPVRSDVIVIACVGLQNPAQMRLAQDNDVVHTLASGPCGFCRT
jgi:hypothetical protein